MYCHWNEGRERSKTESDAMGKWIEWKSANGEMRERRVLMDVGGVVNMSGG